jgi:serine/threonine-protein kinase
MTNPADSGTAPAASDANPPRPQRYGRYVLVDRLGVGGMAEVFRAVVIGPEQFQRVVVVKRILPHLTENGAFVKMFIDEATLCGRLSHPNIIQVHEFGKQDGSYFIAMEFVEGRNLSSVLSKLSQKGEHVPITVAAEIIRQTCLGLGYAHSLRGADGKPLNIIHRDITPSNLMMAFTGAVKILDFGIARVANEARISSTDAGQVKGKSSYLAPEALKNGSIDGRVDVFSAGIVLHEALTGRRLFKGTSPLQTMKMIQEMEVPRPSKFNAAVPSHLDDIVLRALKRNPDERYQTATEMADALEALLIEQRTSSQELPRFMRALFEGEVEGTPLPQEEIRALLAAPPVRSKAATPEPAPGASSEELQDVDVDVMGSDGDMGAFDLDVEGALAARRKRRLIVAGAGAAVLVLIILLIATRSRPTAPVAQQPPAPAPTAPAAAPAPPAPAPQPSPTATPPRPAPAPAPAAVKIAITSEPVGADVVQGDKTIGKTPVSVTFSRSARAIELRVTKDGYVAGALQVVPDADKPVFVTLARVAPPPPPEPEGEGQTQTPRSHPRTRRAGGKVRNAVPIDPFAQ